MIPVDESIQSIHLFNEIDHPTKRSQVKIHKDPLNHRFHCSISSLYCDPFIEGGIKHCHKMKLIEIEKDKKTDCSLCLKVCSKFWNCSICNMFICEDCGEKLSNEKYTRSNKNKPNELKLYMRIEPFFCDNCKEDFEPGLSFYCVSCNYDVCPDCFFNPETKQHDNCMDQPASIE